MPSAPQRPMLTGSFGCDLCDGTGFEPFERGSYSFVRHCPRGCKPYRSQDGPRGDARVEEWSAASYGQDFGKVAQRGASEPTVPSEAWPGIEARLKAICRAKVRAKVPEFRYPGIEEDMAAVSK